jgi:Mannosyl-glycoprotein endo-beta-N-acetylglucosaminidase
VPPASRPQWQQATALITIGAGGLATGLSIVPKAPADLTSPAGIPPVTLLALEHANGPAPGKDAMLRAAIVHVARHFLRLAQTRSPAEMEAMIWQYASTDGANHGPSCAAFASLTLELGSHIAGLDSWVTGGASYPWPVHTWADGRVDPNPASPGVTSVLQDAQSHDRWRPLGDGYAPQPGDWVLFDGHVEVVTKYHSGVLHTIGGDSLPNMSVNAHEYAGSLHDQGVAGFVDNGVGMSKPAAARTSGGGGGRHSERPKPRPAKPASATPAPSAEPSHPAGPPAPAASGYAASGGAASAGPATTADAVGGQPELAPRAIAVPRTVPRSRYAQASRALPAQGARPAPVGGQAAGAAARTPRAAQAAAGPQQPNRQVTRTPAADAGQPGRRADHRQHADRSRALTADVPATGMRPARPHHARRGEAAIPGLLKGGRQHHGGDGSALPPYHRHDVPPGPTVLPGTAAQQAFIKQVATGAVDTQRRYGVPASVTIAQAIDESGWGQSILATSDHNLFGIKGTGPAGSDEQPTQEVINGQLVNLSASFQIYQSIAQSIDAHGRLLARSGDYANAMSRSKDPNAFATALTGVYATDPGYGAKLIQLMQQYDLYRFDRTAAHGDASGTARGGAQAAQHSSRAAHRAGQTGGAQPDGKRHPARSPLPQPTPGPRKASHGGGHTPSPQDPGPVGNPVPVPPPPVANPVPGQVAPAGNPVPVQPGPSSPAHSTAPAQGAQAGHHAGAHLPAQAADREQIAHPGAAPQPAATLYPGRSARPAPLAHPARPADLARRSRPSPGQDRAATSAPTHAQLHGYGAEAAPGASQPGTGTGTGKGGPAGFSSVDSGAGQGMANVSADAAIPGVPHATAQRAGNGHARRPISRLRPAHPAVRPSVPASQAGTGRPAAAPAVSQAGRAMIPGLPHDGAGSRRGTAPDSAATAVAQGGGSSIPGLRPGTAAPSTSRPAPPVAPAAAAPERAAGGRSNPAKPPSPRAAPTAAPAAAPSPAAQAHSNPAAPPSPRAAPTARPAAAPSPAAQAHSNPAAPPSPRAAPTARPAAAASQAAVARSKAAAPRGSGQPATRRPPAPTAAAPGGQGQGAASAAPAAANRVAAPARPVPAAANPLPAAAAPSQGGADVPGLVHGTSAPAPAGAGGATANPDAGSPAGTTAGDSTSRAPGRSPASSPAPTASATATLTVYHAHMPPSVREAFVTSAKMPLLRAEPLYRDVAGHTGIRWEILAACDWMQCKARHGYSPVYGEKLGTVNLDDTCYRTKSAALEQCASDLLQLARSVYRLDIATNQELTVRDLASVFAAFRWGGLLRQHNTSAMDFPYSVAGLTADHTHMRWPNIAESSAPDKPGSRFRQPFGAVPVVLGLNYEALM